MESKLLLDSTINQIYDMLIAALPRVTKEKTGETWEK